MTPLLKVSAVKKRFKGPPSVEILKGVSFELFPGETLAIMGRSGEGKSSLLHILGALDTATEGSVSILNRPLDPKDAEEIRNRYIGFIFQSYYLLEDFSVLENVLMPLWIKREKLTKEEARQYGLLLLHEVGLTSQKDQLAKQLSGGEKQRLAIARALCNRPPLILADEPTGNLDSANAKMIQDLLLTTVAKFQTALIVVTHDIEFALRCKRALKLHEGLLEDLVSLPLETPICR